MMYKALVSFSGVVSMQKGEVRTISDLSIAESLLKVNYISPEKEKKTKSPKRKESK